MAIVVIGNITGARGYWDSIVTQNIAGTLDGLNDVTGLSETVVQTYHNTVTIPTSTVVLF